MYTVQDVRTLTLASFNQRYPANAQDTININLMSARQPEN